MTESKQMKTEEEKMGIVLAATAVTGIVIGAGLAIVAALALNNQANREKIDKAVQDLKKQGSEFITDVKRVASNKKNDADDLLEEGRDKVEKIAKVIKE